MLHSLHSLRVKSDEIALSQREGAGLFSRRRSAWRPLKSILPAIGLIRDTRPLRGGFQKRGLARLFAAVRLAGRFPLPPSPPVRLSALGPGWAFAQEH